MNNPQVFWLDMLLPIFTAGGLIVGVVFFVVFLGISLTVFLATKSSPVQRRVLILIAMLLVTILGSIGFLAGGVYLDVSLFDASRPRYRPNANNTANQNLSNLNTNNSNTVKTNQSNPAK